MRYMMLLAVLAAALAGCTPAGGKGAAPPQGQNNGGQASVQQANDGQAQQDYTSRLEELAKRIPQVQDARCVVIGKTAIVGIHVDPKLERAKVDSIKYSVAEALRKDPQGINAYVTADMAVGERIREVREDIIAGKPFAGFAEELGDIIGRVMPQMPRDTQPMDTHENETPDAKNFQNGNL